MLDKNPHIGEDFDEEHRDLWGVYLSRCHRVCRNAIDNFGV
mgnify:FL=1